MNKHLFGLTPQQVDAVENLAHGMERKTIASAMGLSVKTVEFHLAKAMEHLKVHSDKALIVWALENGFGQKLKVQARPVSPRIVKNSDQLAEVLLATCQDAANGVANPVQANVLCQCAGTLIDLFRLKMEIDGRNPKGNSE